MRMSSSEHDMGLELGRKISYADPKLALDD